jgi:hypothetical protein
MTFNECFTPLVSGYKIKLPEWGGYWFMDNQSRGVNAPFTEEYIKSNVRVYTKDGEILATPHFEKYEHREDWEVVEE